MILARLLFQSHVALDVMRLTSILLTFFTLQCGTAMATDIELFHALTGKPLELQYRQDQVITEAVETFYSTRENPYAGDETAIADGLKIYKKQCQACHLKDGKGRIGPNLTDNDWLRPRTDTDVGRFEIIYGGGAGAMQAFGRRIDQDDILKVMAFIDTFRAESASPE